MTIAPIYKQFFSETEPTDWAPFQSTEEELRTMPLTPDFSVQDRSWCDLLACVGEYTLKTACLPLTAIRFAFQRGIMGCIYPPQNFFAQRCCLELAPAKLVEQRITSGVHLQTKNGFNVRHVILEKNGTKYSGLLLGRPETLRNGKWALIVSTNCDTAENIFYRLSYSAYALRSYNILTMNGPGVGASQGLATPDTMGDAQEIGLRFLETAVNAKKIAISGHCLGALTIGEAILQHEFKTDQFDYHVVSVNAMDSISNHVRHTCTSKICCIGPCLIHTSGCEMNAIKASQKLLALGIRELVINRGKDGVIDDDSKVPKEAAKGHILREKKMERDTLEIQVSSGGHLSYPDALVKAELEKWEKSLEIIELDPPSSTN